MLYFVNNLPYDPCTSGSFYQLRSRFYAEHSPAYIMAANAGVVKAIVSFYRIADSDTTFERHRSRMPINDVNTVHALKKHLVSFLGLKELASKYGLGDFDIKVYRMAPKPGGKSDNFAITTDDQWKLELPSMLDDTGSEMNSMYSKCICIWYWYKYESFQVVQKAYWVRLRV